MAYIGIRDGVKTPLGDVPASLLDSDEFRAQFDAIHLDDAGNRERCEQHITRYYPTFKQLNLMRVGTAEEVAKMGAFIDACRAWSNGDSPDPAALEAIRP